MRDCKNWQLLGPKPSPDFTLKIVVIGNTGVGRRSFGTTEFTFVFLMFVVRAFAPPTSNQIEWSDGQGTGIVKRTTVVNFKKKVLGNLYIFPNQNRQFLLLYMRCYLTTLRNRWCTILAFSKEHMV